MARNNILLRCLPVLKRVQLPNGRVFFAKYERVSCVNLPRNVTSKRRRNIGLKNRGQPRGKGMIGNILKTGVNLGSRFLNSALGKK